MEEKPWYKVPIIHSIADTATNYGKAINFGFDLPESIKKGKLGYGASLDSVGGALSVFGLAPIGAAAGAFVGSQMEGANIGTTALVGAGIGFATLPAIGLAGRASYELGKGYLNVGANLIDKLLENKGNIAKVAGGGGATLAGLVAKPVIRNLQGLVGLSSTLIDFGKDAEKLSEAKLTKAGMFAIGATGVIAGAKGAINELQQAHMGTMMPGMVRNTPNIPSYANDGNATGDLVFALNRNRRG